LGRGRARAGEALTVPTAPHPYAAPLVLVQAFYPSAARLALARGRTPIGPGTSARWPGRS